VDQVTLPDLVRRNAAAFGFDLSGVDDLELGARLATLPADVADDVDLTCLYLTFGHRGAAERRRRHLQSVPSEGAAA
jgi:hypothetical protein